MCTQGEMSETQTVEYYIGKAYATGVKPLKNMKPFAENQ